MSYVVYNLCHSPQLTPELCMTESSKSPCTPTRLVALLSMLLRNQATLHWVPVFFFLGYQGGRTPTGWPHTAQSGEPDCRGPEAKPHQRDTPSTPIPGGPVLHDRRLKPALGLCTCDTPRLLLTCHCTRLLQDVTHVSLPSSMPCRFRMCVWTC
jgi:hypothetical protein